jgi:hypothetical protein
LAEQNQPASPAASNEFGSIFIGPNGLRAGWSALLFVVIFILSLAFFAFTITFLLRGMHQPSRRDMTPLSGILNEVLQLCSWFVAAYVMARFESKPILSYNYSGACRVRRFFFGLLWGFAAISALVLSLWKFGWLSFDSGDFTGLHSLKYAAAWAAVFLAVGFAEESILRGYLQSTLTRGLGFWWAALILSAGFGGIHLGNPGESPIGIFSAAVVGLAFCLSLWYTGSLWWAIGFHGAWDWGESYFYGTADSGIVSHGRRVAAHPIGSALWSGGTAGPEGSVLVLVVIALLALGMYLWWRPGGWNRRVISPFKGSAWKPLRPTQPK